MNVLTYIIYLRYSVGKMNNMAPSNVIPMLLPRAPQKWRISTRLTITRWLTWVSNIEQFTCFLGYAHSNKYVVYPTIRYFIKLTFWSFHSSVTILITMQFGNDRGTCGKYDNLQVATSIWMFPPITSRENHWCKIISL